MLPCESATDKWELNVHCQCFVSVVLPVTSCYLLLPLVTSCYLLLPLIISCFVSLPLVTSLYQYLSIVNCSFALICLFNLEDKTSLSATVFPLLFKYCIIMYFSVSDPLPRFGKEICYYAILYVCSFFPPFVPWYKGGDFFCPFFAGSSRVSMIWVVSSERNSYPPPPIAIPRTHFVG